MNRVDHRDFIFLDECDRRKLNFHRFPYAIIYSVHADELYIKGVMHLHRRPFYWKHRKRS